MATCIGRERGHDRGRPGGNEEILEEMRELRAHLEAMEMDKRRDPGERDVSEPKDEDQREEPSYVFAAKDILFIIIIFHFSPMF